MYLKAVACSKECLNLIVPHCGIIHVPNLNLAPLIARFLSVSNGVGARGGFWRTLDWQRNFVALTWRHSFWFRPFLIIEFYVFYYLVCYRYRSRDRPYRDRSFHDWAKLRHCVITLIKVFSSYSATRNMAIISAQYILWPTLSTSNIIQFPTLITVPV